MTGSAEKTMIIPIFIINQGCPHKCIFCNQHIAAGNHPAEITKDVFDKLVEAYLATRNNKKKKVEIAFYGGNFTGISEAEQEKLLSWADYYIHEGLVHEIRISTRPDYITDDSLQILKQYNVTTVELGAQSFVDDVLAQAQRGHDSRCTEQAITLLKEHSFYTCLHLMAGLPHDTKEGFVHSLDKTVELKPDMARISPTLVLRDTLLAEQYAQGRYKPLDLAGAVSLCRLALEKFSLAGIRIIRFGLHMTDEMRKSGALIAGPVHPSLGDLAQADFFYHKILAALKDIPGAVKKIHFLLSPCDVAAFRGSANSRLAFLQSLYPASTVIIDTARFFNRGDISVYADHQCVVHTNIYGAAANYETEAR